MGSLRASEFADAVAQGELSLDAALEYHLTANHYPPHPRFMIAVAKAAIEAANEDDWDRQSELPDGVEWRDGSLPSAGEVIDSLHLDSFVLATP